MAQELLHATLENEIRALAAEIRAGSGATMTPEAARDAVKAAIGERIKHVDFSAPVGAANVAAPAAGASTASTGTSDTSTVLPKYAQSLPKEQQLRAEQLADMALHEGLAPAVAEAKKSDPIILDVLHDTLAGKLYNVMKERGLL